MKVNLSIVTLYLFPVNELSVSFDSVSIIRVVFNFVAAKNIGFPDSIGILSIFDGSELDWEL